MNDLQNSLSENFKVLEIFYLKLLETFSLGRPKLVKQLKYVSPSALIRTQKAVF